MPDEILLLPLAEILAQYPDDVEGVDVSWWQGRMNWAITGSKVSFAYIRAGSINDVTGVCYTDYEFEYNADHAADHVDKVGYYWFMRPKWDPIKQADYFYNLTKNKPRSLPLACDIEVNGSAHAVKLFCERLYFLTGERPVIYTNPNTWLYKLTGDKDWAVVYPLWIANWDVNEPQIPPPWTEFAMWQYAVLPDGREYGAQSKSLDHNIGKHSFVYQDPPEPPDPPTAQEYEIVNCTWLNGRTETNSTKDNRVISMRAGQVVEKIDQDGRWVKVRYKGEFWMHSGYLEEV